MRRVQVKTVISHCDCDCELKKKVVTTSVTTTKKAGSHSLVMVSLRSQLFFGHIQNHSFNLDPPHIFLKRERSENDLRMFEKNLRLIFQYAPLIESISK